MSKDKKQVASDTSKEVSNTQTKQARGTGAATKGTGYSKNSQ